MAYAFKQETQISLSVGMDLFFIGRQSPVSAIRQRHLPAGGNGHGVRIALRQHRFLKRLKLPHTIQVRLSAYFMCLE